MFDFSKIFKEIQSNDVYHSKQVDKSEKHNKVQENYKEKNRVEDYGIDNSKISFFDKMIIR